MRRFSAVLLFVLIAGLACISFAAQKEAAVGPSPNGISMPGGYRDWRVIASSVRSDNNTLRVILGNDTAIAAARAGKTNPWPDGSVMAKLVWKQKQHPVWKTAVVPGEFVQVEFMVKDARLYESTGGWGFARWVGMEQRPFGEDASFAQTCFQCHEPMAGNDYVYTSPAEMP